MFRRSPNSPSSQPVVDPQAVRSPWIYRIGGPSPPSIESASASKRKVLTPDDQTTTTTTLSTRHRYLSMPRRLPSEITRRLKDDAFHPDVAPGSFKEPSTTPPGLKPILKRRVSRSLSTEDIIINNNNDKDHSTRPWSATKPDPHIILSSLSRTFNLRLEDYVDPDVLVSLHTQDRFDAGERTKERNSWRSGKPMSRGGEGSGLVVFSEPLHKTSIYASSSVVLGGRDHDLPIVVVGCVEELYRTGIYQPNLFRALPNRARLLELINVFDSHILPSGSFVKSRPSSSGSGASAPIGFRPSDHIGFGANISLHLESTPDICALLSTYLTSLPEPIFPPALFRALWDWCGVGCEYEYECGLVTTPTTPTMGLTQTPTTTLPNTTRQIFSSIPLTRTSTYTHPLEKSHIAIAQNILHLLPSPNFSLLVYLLAFFSQVVMVSQENGVGVEDVGRMFGGALFGGGVVQTVPKSKGGSSGSATVAIRTATAATRTADTATTKTTTKTTTTPTEAVRKPREGELMMSWFLKRWAPISDGLFALVDELELELGSGLESSRGEGGRERDEDGRERDKYGREQDEDERGQNKDERLEDVVPPDVWKPYRDARGVIVGTPHPLLGSGGGGSSGSGHSGSGHSGSGNTPHRRPPWPSDPLVQTSMKQNGAAGQKGDYFSITPAEPNGTRKKTNVVKFEVGAVEFEEDVWSRGDVKLGNVEEDLLDAGYVVSRAEPTSVIIPPDNNNSNSHFATDSPSSSIDVYERLQDISLPPSITSSPLLAQMMIQMVHPPPVRNGTPSLHADTPSADKESTDTDMDIDHARTRIRQLERELEVREVSIGSLRGKFDWQVHARREVEEKLQVVLKENLQLQAQVQLLGAGGRGSSCSGSGSGSSSGSGSGSGDLKQALSDALEERDEALRLVAEMRNVLFRKPFLC